MLRRLTRGEIWAKSYFGAGLVQFSESAYSWSGIPISSMALAFTITFKQPIVSVGIQVAASKVQATLVDATKAARNSHDRYQLLGELQARVGTVIRAKFSLVELAIKRAWRVPRS